MRPNVEVSGLRGFSRRSARLPGSAALELLGCKQCFVAKAHRLPEIRSFYWLKRIEALLKDYEQHFKYATLVSCNFLSAEMRNSFR